VTAGLMSPYPAGIPLPEPEQRRSCAELWPPVFAADDAQPVGDWSIVERGDGRLQWAYREQPLYTSIRDRQPGDTFGGTRRYYGGSGDKPDGDTPAVREPVGPPPLVPAGFRVKTMSLGRMLSTDRNSAVYAFAGDGPQSSACKDSCLHTWQPLEAPVLARALGEWNTFERAPGIRQWTFRGRPLYTYRYESHPWSQEGSDEAGWENVFTQRAPPPPSAFTVQATLAGEVLADSRGRTIYIYRCGEDSADQLACDHPDDTQVYRLAMCGAGDPRRCLRNWPYVLAEEGASSEHRAWRVVSIDPTTGRFADTRDAGALRVWAYRDRPVYTYAGDQKPGDVNGSGIGEWRGKRNGLIAFWLRDDYLRGTY
jgi:predicted lipoprotein with Yx(FWY)xxD motif